VHDGGNGFERDAKENRFAIGNPALNSTGTIGQRANFSCFHAKEIVVLAACQKNSAEAGTDIKTF
jgi:hypothetical protein